MDIQHHADQFLHKLSMLEVPLSTVLIVDDRNFTVGDLLKSSLQESHMVGDVSWTVSAFSYYLKPGQRWTNKFGETMSLGRLLKHLLARPSLFCGGAHKSLAIARLTRNDHWRDDSAVAPFWTELNELLVEQIAVLRLSQQPSGCFQPPPELVFRSENGSPRRPEIHFTGHSLEWLTFAMTSDDLCEDWVLDAAIYLVKTLEQEYPDGYQPTDSRSIDAERDFGGISHSLSGLTRWLARMTSPHASHVVGL